MKKYFLFLNKYQSVTHVSSYIIQGLFENMVFRSVALVTKQLWAILVFFSHTGLFFRPVTYLINLKKYFLTKNPLNYYSLTVTKFPIDSVKK